MTNPPTSSRSDAELLNESLGLVAPRADDLIRIFYDQLFATAPAVRALFPQDMTAQRDKVLSAIIAVVGNYHQRDELVPGLQDLGRRRCGSARAASSSRTPSRPS